MKTALVLLTAALAPLAAGCTSMVNSLQKDHARYYVLAAPEPPPAVPADDLRPDVEVNVAGFTLPDYLDRSEIVLRPSAHRLDARETELWLEPPPKACARVLAQTLARRLGSRKITVGAASDISAKALVLHADALAFEGTPEQGVTLRVRWRISRAAGGPALGAGEHTGNVKPPAGSRNGEDYSGYVAALGLALDGFAAVLAGEIRRL